MTNTNVNREIGIGVCRKRSSRGTKTNANRKKSSGYCLKQNQPIPEAQFFFIFNKLNGPGMLENFSFLLLSKIRFFSMTLYDADLAFAVLETDERENVLMRLHNVIENLKQHNQVNFS